MMLLYTDPRFLLHETGSHPECAERLHHITRELETTGLVGKCTQPTWEPAGDEAILRVHHSTLTAQLQRLATQGGGRVDPDTVVSPQSFEIAKLAAGAVCDATQQILAGTAKRALCLVRPPGHHALADRAMGFCLLNDIAVAAQAALDSGVDRLLVVDWDVHHGNGTQACFYDEPRVGFFSAHRWPFYPGTGSVEETGTGDGLGTTRNLPVEFGTSRETYRQEFARELEDFAARIKPELVLVSAGFDSHRLDPIGSLGLEVEDFSWLTTTVTDIANTYAKGRVVSTLEGGYNPPVLAECVAAHLEALQDT
jgi:acetoin utilization deacetylase AcuC-like enzyme